MLRMLSAQDYQTVAFFGLAAVFEMLERVRPAREIDRWKDLKIDAFSFALAIAMNRISHYTVTGFVNTYTPAWLLNCLHRLQGLPGAVKIVMGIFIVDFIISWIPRAQSRFTPTCRTHAW